MILVVEDETRVAGVLEELLHRAGFTVVSARGAEQALKIFRSSLGEVEAVVTDIAMPGIDGPALAKRLREIDPKLPVLFITGYAEYSGQLEGPVLLKPFSGAELAHEVRRLIER